MSREEEIQRKAGDLADFGISHGQPNQQQYYEGFIDGAKWADQHPRKELWDGKKVIEFIKGNVREYHKVVFFHVDDFVKDLTKAMEE